MAKPRPCVVPCCEGEKFDLVHKFPTDRERAELWRRIIGVSELIHQDIDSIRGKYFVCTRHFRDSDYKNKFSRSLNITANPSLNLQGLCDAEGLNRIAPPLVRPPMQHVGAEQQLQQQQLQQKQVIPSVMTINLDVQPMQMVAETASDDEKSMVCIYDPMADGMHESQHELVQIENRPQQQSSPVGNFKLTPVSQKRTMDMRTLAGGTPGKIFKFKRKDNTLVEVDPSKIGSDNQMEQMESVILKRVKVSTPQKTQQLINRLNQPVPEVKIPTASVETQTEEVIAKPKKSNESDQQVDSVEPAAEEEDPAENKTTTKVLALLECTPDNLAKLQRKMMERGGLLPFDEKLFQDDEEDDESAMNQKIADERLFLTLKQSEEAEPIRISYIWLRDHCRCNECYNHNTFQRSLSILDIPEDVSPESYEIQEQNLNVLWKDGHASTYGLDFLFESQLDVYKESLLQERSQAVLWDRELITLCPEYCRVTLNELLCEDEVVKRAVASLVMYGVAFIEKVPANQQSTEMAVRRIFPIHKTLFGEMWTFSDSMDHSDTAYTKGYLGPHTDNTYFSDASGLQVLHCIQFNGSGGETILTDGFKATEQLKLKNPEAFDRLCAYPLTAEYLEEGKHHTSCAPVIKRNIMTEEVEQLRFNTYDRAVLKTLPQEKIPQFYSDYKQLAAEIHDETMPWKFRLTPGTVMIFDNWRVLHGRLAYSGKRVMTGCYVSRTDYQSVARTLGLIS